MVNDHKTIYLHRRGPLLKIPPDRPGTRYGRYGLASFPLIFRTTVSWMGARVPYDDLQRQTFVSASLWQEGRGEVSKISLPRVKAGSGGVAVSEYGLAADSGIPRHMRNPWPWRA